MSATVERAGKIWTEAELQALPNNGYNYEVVDGELIMSPKNNLQHGDLCTRLGFSRRSAEFFPGGPDLAVEIMAPWNTRAEMDARLRDFFTSGTQLAWVIHPDDEFVEVCHSPAERQIIGAGACLDGEQLLPGFQFAIADLFNAGDWD